MSIVILVWAIYFLFIVIILSGYFLYEKKQQAQQLQQLTKVGAVAQDSEITDDRGLEELMTSLGLLSDRNEMDLKILLSSGGYFRHQNVMVYLAAQYALPLIFVFITFLLYLLNYFGLFFWFFILLPTSLFAYFIPKLFLSLMRWRHQRAIQQPMTLILEFILICIEVGISTEDAILMIAEGMRAMEKDHVVREMLRIHSDLRRLPERSMAWDNLMDRVGSDEFNLVINILKQNESLGVSIVSALRNQIDTLRREKVSTIQKKASLAKTKIDVALTALVLPPTLVLLISPAIIRLIDQVMAVPFLRDSMGH